MNTYQIVTNLIIEELKKGIVPWMRPATGENIAYSYETGKPYHGINRLLLTEPGGYLTHNAVKRLGGSFIPSGLTLAELDRWAEERWAEQPKRMDWWNTLSPQDKDQFYQKVKLSRTVTFYKMVEMKDVKKEEREQGEGEIVVKDNRKYYPVFRMYDVVNVKYVKGLDTFTPPVVNADAVERDGAEAVIEDYCTRTGVTMKYGQNEAGYDRLTDTVNMRDIRTYSQEEEYYADLFHQLVHSTGAEERLSRSINKDKRGEIREELVAEMGSAMVCATLQLDTDKAFDMTVSKIQGWINALEEDCRLCITAASKADKAADLILGKVS